jgi:hypothetical protein
VEAIMPSDVRQNTARSRFELEADGEIAFMNYRLAGGALSMNHTETPMHLRGRGIASRLVAGALEMARQQGLKVVPRCPFVAAYVKAHPEFNDILA